MDRKLMKKRVIINIFVLSSIIVLILVLVKTGIAEKSNK